VQKIPIGKGCFTLVSDEDFDLVNRFTWHKTDHGYVRGRVGNSLVLLHCLILKKKNKKLKIDHIDGDRLNNTRENLRVVTSSTNNQSKINIRKLPFLGVLRRKSGNYYATISKNKKVTSFGPYESPVEAAIRYDIEVQKFYGPLAMTNAKMLQKLLALILRKK